MNPRDSEQNLCSPKYMKIALLDKDLLQVHPDATSNGHSGCISCRGQGMEKLKTIPAWDSGAKRRLVWKHKETKRKSSLLH